MRIIPAIDLINGKCVRLTQGDYNSEKIYNSNPVDVAKSYEDAGLKYLHLVDLDGARTGKVVHWKILEKIAATTSLKIDFGGGIKTDADAELVFRSGASQLTAGSIAVENPELVCDWINRYGSEKIILGCDVREGRIATSGWTAGSELNIADYMNHFISAGAKYTISTDVSKDGMMAGPAFGWYEHLVQSFPTMKIIASGGIRSLTDLHELSSAGLEGAILGKALYEGALSLKQLSDLC